ncbi:MAG: sugar transferase [Patescibacteria group bacterium]
MRKSQLIFLTALLPLDFIMLILAGISIYFLRFKLFKEVLPIFTQIPYNDYVFKVVLIALVWIGIFVLLGLYSIKNRKHFTQEIGQIFIGCSMGTMLIVLFLFFQREYFTSRFIILAGWIASFVFLSIGRFLIHLIQLIFFKQGIGLEPILILGQGKEVEELINSCRKNLGHGYNIIGQAASVDELINNWSNRVSNFDEIIQGDPNISRSDILRLIAFCKEYQINFKYAADLFGTLSSNVSVETMMGRPYIEVKRAALDGWGRVAKRILDIIFSFLSLIILSPFFVLLGVIIKLDSSGPIFIALTRVGQRGKLFKLYKFRSMVKNAEQLKKDLIAQNERKDGPLFKMKNDPRVTRLGRFIRRYSIDELPQLLNVFKGQMSLVGPRPHQPDEVSQYDYNQKELLFIKPGMTGLAQVSGRSGLSFGEEVRLDLFYVHQWSIWLDLKILLKTIVVVLSSKHSC